MQKLLRLDATLSNTTSLRWVQFFHRFTVALVIAGTVIAVNPCVAADEAVKASAVVETIAPAEPAGEEMDFLASLQAAEEKRPRQTEESSTPMTVLRFFFSLALVLGLCYVTMLGLKKFSNVKSAVGISRGRIRVVENSTLGANRTLHLVEIGSKRLLVASTPNQVNLLAELEIDDVPEPAPQERSPGFKEQLAMFLGNKTDTTKSAMTVAQMLRDSSSYMQGRVREVGSFRRMFRNVENG